MTPTVKMKKVLFLDRDGTLIVEPDDLQVDQLDKLQFLPDVIYYLRRIVEEMDFELVLVTNQDGLGTEAFPESDFWPAQNHMMAILASQGIAFTEVCIDRTFARDNEPTRKPGVALIQKYIDGKYDLSKSYMVGDRLTDIQFAKNFGGKGILLGRSTDKVDDNQLDTKALESTLVLKTNKWKVIYDYLKAPPRLAEVFRETAETQIKVDLNLDGKGISDISTGLGFFDHMLEQLSRHSLCDMTIHVDGDLHIDEHHTIEDTALALGEAFKEALGDKVGIERYGFLLPMDDVLAQAAIDFSGRPWLVWKAKFKREQIGDMPSEMFMHFFKSFSDAAGCNLNIKAKGGNEHHKIEAIFKAVAKAIRMAVSRTGVGLPSTKGKL